jgi:chemotaxis protein methyltransferase WspC
MKQIENLLRQQIGLDAASIGSSLIERTVRLRMKSLRVKNIEDYKRLLASSRTEWDELVEAVVVTETWFFRDKEPFQAFVQLVQSEWLRRPAWPANTLHVLSIPCSSGEEPYSLVMALLDAGVPKERFIIDAVDISVRALARAQRAIYGKNSFRGKDRVFRDRYFLRTNEDYALNPLVRERVRFQQANLLGDDFMAGRASYDFIFCRNLLIYFDRATQTRALEKLNAILSPSGFLFVGPAELPLVLDRGFASANMPMAFACRKAAAPPHPAVLRAHVRGAATGVPAGNSELPRHPAREASPGIYTDLMTARQLADAGKLDEAAAICEANLSANGPTAQAYYLLGLVHDARNDPLAVEFYRKALYLEPDHYETLIQMALLAAKNGDTAKARAFKRRAERAVAKSVIES